MKTVVPAQPGFFITYPDGEEIPIIAWEICDRYDGDFDVWPITPEGLYDEGGVVTYTRDDGSTVWWRDRPMRRA